MEVHFEIISDPNVVTETVVPELKQVISFLHNNSELSEETIGLLEILVDNLKD